MKFWAYSKNSILEFYLVSSKIEITFFEVIEEFQISKPAPIARLLARGHGQFHMRWKKNPKLIEMSNIFMEDSLHKISKKLKRYSKNEFLIFQNRVHFAPAAGLTLGLSLFRTRACKF